jgi:HD-GYP domain-containing protein (c-di-GMP phosphodiesterase class II)
MVDTRAQQDMCDTFSKTFTSIQNRQLENFGRRVNGFGVNFAVCGSDCEVMMLAEAGRFTSDRQQISELAKRVLSQNANQSCSDRFDVPVWRFADVNFILAVVLNCPTKGLKQAQAVGVALIDLGSVTTCLTHRPQSKAIGTEATQTDDIYMAEMLAILAENFQVQFKAEEQIEMVGIELARVYEELVLLHQLGTNMKVTEEDANFLQMACDSLTEVVLVEGIAIVLEKTVDGERKLLVAAGSGLIDIDDRMAAILHSRLIEEIDSGNEALLDSEIDTPFKYDWPENIRNIIAVPLCGKEKVELRFSQRTRDGNYVMGLMVAVNRIDKLDFDSTDVKLFNSVASSCAVFIENGRLFGDLKELFIGSLKALTRSIDAKDKYTRGHSERVALISRWIAERLAEHGALRQDQIHKVYLAGLLHDVGKIGIEESVLRKKGKLSQQEWDRIRKHPSIGAGILRGIKQMRDIVPAVLCHHERIDGKGYPDGLTGDEIPLTGKIIGLADSFDAMTSKRSYREARTVEDALAEIEKGLGTQFDERIGRIFLESDVYQLWDIMQEGFRDIYGSTNFSEYGIAAVGTLIR